MGLGCVVAEAVERIVPPMMKTSLQWLTNDYEHFVSRIESW